MECYIIIDVWVQGNHLVYVWNAPLYLTFAADVNSGDRYGMRPNIRYKRARKSPGIIM